METSIDFFQAWFTGAVTSPRYKRKDTSNGCVSIKSRRNCNKFLTGTTFWDRRYCSLKRHACPISCRTTVCALVHWPGHPLQSLNHQFRVRQRAQVGQHEVRAREAAESAQRRRNRTFLPARQ